jgi:hypothetical protein
MLTTAVISAIAFVAVFAAVIALCLWRRLGQMADKVYRLGWDIDALAGSISMGEGYETTERPDS